MRLVIVESPTKAQTIQKYLGEGYRVVATAGHFRDLPDEELGVDLRTFEPRYVLTAEKGRYVAAIRQALAGAREVYLATDADREGEAISWHLAQTFGLRTAKRMRFTEITKAALTAAVSHAGPLDQHLVDAQQARRVLDRLVGYQVSPLLRVYGNNHSAGRVQTATLHLVVERELEREAFVPVPFWTVTAHYASCFSARYVARTISGGWSDGHLATEAEARAVEEIAQANPHRLTALTTRPVERRPKPPFTTSTLQQAGVQLGLKPEHTMAAAQALFEKGLISYHRTDSVALSEESLALARGFIARDYPAGLPPAPVRYRPKATAQGAHEAIHPTATEPALPPGLAGHELALYDLIRRRFLASQCLPALVDETEAILQAGPAFFRATGSVVTFPGFLHYLDGDEEQEEPEARSRLPHLRQGDVHTLEDLIVERKQTAPKPRFTRASLIREMERLGIGRPATFASSVSVLFEREYLLEIKKQVSPTARGRVIDRALGLAFPELGAASYTAQMEAQLDQVAEGKTGWKSTIGTWYRPFAAALARAGQLFESDARRPEVLELLPEVPRATGRACPLCESPLLLRTGSKGPYVGCTSYPACTYTSDPSAQPSAHRCPTCQGPMEEVDGKYGRFARCLLRPCKGSRDLAALTKEPCPVCQSAMKDRGGFLSCSQYPACRGSRPKQVTTAAPGRRPCPKCQSPMRERRSARGSFWGCSSYPTCRGTAPVAAEPTRSRRRPAS